MDNFDIVNIIFKIKCFIYLLSFNIIIIYILKEFKYA